MKNKKKQHYVWKHYLKPWSVSGQIWCNRNNNIFNTALENIGQQRYFYESYSLNEFEGQVIKGMISKMHPSSHQVHGSTYDIYLSTTGRGEYLQKNGIENYHSSIEGRAIKILNGLYRKDTVLLESDKNRINFCHFLGMQYTRTKRTLDKTTKLLSVLPVKFPEYNGKYDIAKITKVMSLIMADIIGNWIYSDGNISFIENRNKIPLITGDQPIYNLETNPNNDGIAPEKFKLYYPITPRLALLIAEEKQDNCFIGQDVVVKFNDFIYQSSNEQIYSTSKDLLEQYSTK